MISQLTAFYVTWRGVSVTQEVVLAMHRPVGGSSSPIEPTYKPDGCGVSTLVLSTMTTLDKSLSKALNDRATAGNSLADCLNPLLSTRSDFFSNDYLSLDCDPQIHAGLIPHLHDRRLLGSRGTRSLSGSTPHHVELERYFRAEYNAPAALLLNSGYMANITILGSLPQRHDVIVYDELVHASCHDGMRMSRANGAMFSFAHNSPQALASLLRQVAEECENVRLGLSTVFIVLESIYSMFGLTSEASRNTLIIYTFQAWTGTSVLYER